MIDAGTFLVPLLLYLVAFDLHFADPGPVPVPLPGGREGAVRLWRKKKKRQTLN